MKSPQNPHSVWMRKHGHRVRTICWVIHKSTLQYLGNDCVSLTKDKSKAYCGSPEQFATLCKRTGLEPSDYFLRRVNKKVSTVL